MKTEAISTPHTLPGAAEQAAVLAQPKAAARLLFVDNIRIFLTILVVLHHLMVIYAGSGNWPYMEGMQDDVTSALGSWFTSVNHSYFMGLFLLVSAYFVPGSYDRKGAARFLKDRLVRLGIPLAVLGWVVRPALIFAGSSELRASSISFIDWYTHQYFRDYGWIGQGPLWFISALLLFSLLYALWRLLVPSRPGQAARQADFPGSGSILLFALGIAAASFFVRLRFPSDTAFAPLNFQLADFSQYIAMFIVGLVAYRHGWLERLPESTGRRWLVAAIVLILVYPPVAILGGAITDATPFKGGWHWQALVAALWQSLICVSMSISVIYLFRRFFDRQGALGKYLSRNAYPVYLIHEPVITFLAVAAMGIALYPLLKFALAALVSIPLCFALSSLVRKIPYTERVL